jgi:hypothetical protein
MVKFLKYKGQDIPIRVSYYALKMLKEKLGKSLMDITDDDFDAWEVLLFYSLESGYRGIDKPFPYKEQKDIMDVADEVFFDFMEILPQFFPHIEKFLKNQQGEILDIEKKSKKSTLKS